jgi:hypothetical protein
MADGQECCGCIQNPADGTATDLAKFIIPATLCGIIRRYPLRSKPPVER